MGFGLEPFAAIAGVLYGTVFPATQVALRTLAPFDAAFWRATLSLSFLLVVAFWGHQRIRLAHLKRGQWIRLAILALLPICGFQALLNWAVLYAGTVIAAFLASIYPALAVLGAPLVVGEQPSFRRGAGALVAVAGAFLLLGGATLTVADTTGAIVGGLLAFAASLCWSAYALLTRRWTHAYSLDARTITLFGPIFSAPLLLLFALGAAPAGNLLNFRADSFAAILWLGIFGSGIAYLLVNLSLRRAQASRSAPALLLAPIVATIISVAFFGSHLSPLQMAGAAICVAGMLAAGG